MKFAIVIVTAFLVLGASCFVVPEQEVKGSIDENLARVKRGCACGPFGCLCGLSDTSDYLVVGFERTKRSPNGDETSVEDGSSQNLERVKRGCACGPFGCLCGLSDTSDYLVGGFERTKRSSNGDETSVEVASSQNLERVKRGCACGPHGCLCSLRDVDDSVLEFVGIERVKRDVSTEAEDETVERVKRGCACGPHGCLCSLTDTEDYYLQVVRFESPSEDVQRTKRNAALDEEAHSSSINLARAKRCACGPHGCLCGIQQEAYDSMFNPQDRI